MEITPDSLTTPGTVRVSINIINMSDAGVPVSVTLSDPSDKVCSSFGSGGTAYLAPGQSQSYQGNWQVTQKELDAGKVIFSARYNFTNAGGMPISATRPISATIRYNKAVAKLSVERELDPGDNVVEGQNVRVIYHLKNTGTIDITDIVITDPGVLEGEVTYPLLKEGESADLSYNITMGSSSKTTNALIQYSYLENGKVVTKQGQAENPKVINVSIPDVQVVLTASPMTVQPGDKVDLLCKIINKSNLTYEQLKVTDLILGDIDSGLSIGAGRQLEIPKPITVNQTSTYMFTVQGVDSTGAAVTFTSNSVTVTTSGDAAATGVDAVPLDLVIEIEGDRGVFYSEPSDIVFNIRVTNFGATTVRNVIVSAAGKNIRTIEQIAPGETIGFIQQFTGAMGGTYAFVATAKDSTGENSKVTSNPWAVTYEPPPATPTPSPTPTPVPPTPPPEQIDQPTSTVDSIFNQGEEPRLSAGAILLYVLAGLLVIILGAVGTLFYLDRRRNSVAAPSAPSAKGGGGQIVVIDSIQRSPHRDYARAPKRPASAGKGDGKRKRSAPAKQPPTVPAAYDDQTEFEGEEPAGGAMPMAESPPNPVAAHAQDDAGDSIFRRPKQQRRDAETRSAPENEGEEDNAAGGGYNNDYLSRIRNPVASKAKSAETAAPPEEEPPQHASAPSSPPVVPMSDEEAALLSGSTGQYRLSRHSTTAVRPGKGSASKAEDPVSFSRRQRSARAAQVGPSNFYSDEEEAEATPKSRSRRR